MTSKKNLIIAALLPALGLLAVNNAYAQSSMQDKAYWGLTAGGQGGYNRLALSYETAPLWRSSILGKALTLSVESDIAYWHARQDTQADHARNMWQVGVTPMLQWWIGDRWYLEGGIGATAMQHTRFGNRDISTAFQFGDHIGIGTALDDNWRLGLRLSHFSNAGIKEPNPGLNVLSLTLKRSF